MLTVNYALIELTVIIFTVLKQLRIRLTLCFEVRTYSIRFNSGFTWFVIIIVVLKNHPTR